MIIGTNYDQHNITLYVTSVEDCDLYTGILHEKFPDMPVTVSLEDQKIYCESMQGWQPDDLHNILVTLKDATA